MNRKKISIFGFHSKTDKEKLWTLAVMMTQIAEQKFIDPEKKWTNLTRNEKFETYWGVCFIDSCRDDMSMNRDKLRTKTETEYHLFADHKIRKSDKMIVCRVIIAYEKEGPPVKSAGKTKNEAIFS